MSDQDDNKKGPLANGAAQSGTRARNKTVMLTPDVTGHIRDLIGGSLPGQDSAETASSEDASSQAEKTAVDSAHDKNRAGTEAPINVAGAGAAAGAAADSWSRPGGDISASNTPNAGATSSPMGSGSSDDPSTQSKFNTERAKTQVMSRPPISYKETMGAASESNTLGSSNGLGGSGTAVPPIPPSMPSGSVPASASSIQDNPRGATGSSGGFQSSLRQEVKTKLVGFLVSFDNDKLGEVHEIRVGRFMLSSRQAGSEDSMIIKDESISALHAVVRATEDGKIQVLDQLSEQGTGLTPAGKSKEDDVSGSMANVRHGDKLRFGKRNFLVSLIPVDGKSQD